MKLKLGVLFLSLICIQPALAINTLNKPKTCPSISSIATIGVDDVIRNGNYWLGKKYKSKFDTMEEWSYTAASNVLGAMAKEDAIIKYNQKLSMLSLVEGPIPSENGSWFCYYQSKGDAYNQIGVYAYNPPFNSNEIKSN